jgi:hypothetical protein
MARSTVGRKHNDEAGRRRNQDIITAFLRGERQRDIADRYGITPARVHQIVQKNGVNKWDILRALRRTSSMLRGLEPVHAPIRLRLQSGSVRFRGSTYQVWTPELQYRQDKEAADAATRQAGAQPGRG